MEQGGRGPGRGPLWIALAGVVLHLPFVARYDLHFQPDFAFSMRISRSILAGERPIFWWGQSYLGTLGNYLTAGVFAVTGESIPAAAIVSLSIWGCGVALATRLACRLFGARSAWWTAVVGAVGTPYANHYVAQPYSSYETAAVLAVLSIAAVGWTENALRRLPSARASATCVAIGAMLGAGWWTTRSFAPALLAWVLGSGPAVAWRRPPARQVALGVACLVAGFAMGDAPELAYRADPAAYRVGVERRVPLGEVASPSIALANARQAVASLPAYLGGDPRSRLPEGISFAEALGAGVVPSASLPARVADACSAIALVVALAAAVVMLSRGWRLGQPTLLALGTVPFVHSLLLVLSARTGGGYLEARRYWFSILLILPLLIGGAIAISEDLGSRARAAVCTLVATVVSWSALSQARMLQLPDELAAHRALARDLAEQGVRFVVMPTWTAQVLDPLSGGALSVVTIQDDRNPVTVEAALAGDRIAVVSPGDLPPAAEFRLRGHAFARDGAPRRVARWSWTPYARGEGSRD